MQQLAAAMSRATEAEKRGWHRKGRGQRIKRREDAAGSDRRDIHFEATATFLDLADATK
jgi:hypothetical protein